MHFNMVFFSVKCYTVYIVGDRMKYDYRKPNPVNPNNVNMVCGVDINDKSAVRKKLFEMKMKKMFFTFLALIILGVSGILLFDFYRVNFKDARPMISLISKVELGTKYKGVGYSYIVCDDGTKHLNKDDDICITPNGGNRTFKDVLHDILIKYLEENKIVDKKFDDLVINYYAKDSENEKSGYDYYVEFTYSCKDGKDTCFKTLKEKTNKRDVQLYVSIDNTNLVYNIYTFSTSGEQYNKLKEDYKIKVQNYLISHNWYVEENVRFFDIRLVSNKGKTMFGGVEYEDCYLINISYMCNDNGNTCISGFVSEDNNNLSYDVYMYLDLQNEIKFLGNVS